MPKGQLWGFVVRRHDDGYVIGPGSVHPLGVVYDTLRQPSGMPYPIAELPERWVQAVTAATRPAVVVGGPTPLPEPGGRHDWLRDRARFYRGFMDDRGALRAAILAENNRLSQPKSETEVDRAIGDVFSKFPLDPPAEADEKIARRLHEDALGILGAPSSGSFPTPPDPVAFEGLLGNCVLDLAPGTDASLAGLLGALIAFTGALVPGQAYFHRVQTSSPFVALVGESSIGRKGTAMIRISDAMSDALEPVYVNRVILDGLNSGEALVSALSYKREQFAYEPTVGLVFEEEYASLLASRGREGSTLDPKMRIGFDGSPISNRRSGESKTVLPPYWLPALIGITPDELRQRLEAGALQSGSANRWLYLPVVKRPVLADNSEPIFSPEHREAILAARRWSLDAMRTLRVDPAVNRTLGEYSDFLPIVSLGVARDLTRRLAIIAFRVALVHAMAERSGVVGPAHLARALALTEYARAGIGWVFGETVGNRDADLLLRHLMAQGQLSKTSITREIIRDPIRQQAAIDELVRLNLAVVVTEVPTHGGRKTVLRTVGAERISGFPSIANLISENGRFLGNLEARPESRTNGSVERGNALEERRTDDGDTPVETGSPLAWAKPCRDYAHHTSSHRLTPEGWVCDVCWP